jgi:hypothetical protein
MPDQGTFTADGSVRSERGARPNASYATLMGSGTFGGGTLKVRGVYFVGSTEVKLDLPSVALTADGLVSWAHNADALEVYLSGATDPNLLWALR